MIATAAHHRIVSVCEAQLNVNFRDTEAVEAKACREDLEARIDTEKRTFKFTFGARVWPAQDREAPAVSAGAVHLPTHRAT